MRKRTKKFLPFFILATYLVTIHFFMGLRNEHYLLSFFMLLCYYVHPKSRQFVIDFLPFCLFGIFYDFLRIFPKEWAGPIHVEWPYILEMKLFGFRYLGQYITPNNFFQIHHVPLLDFVTGFFYALHMATPLGFSLWVWKKNKLLSRTFNYAFLLVNAFSFATYIIFPVAPPWYIENYGFLPATWDIPGNAAGLVHFDKIIGFPYFQAVYSKNAWVHGALPSMHAGFPFLVSLFSRHHFRKGVFFFYAITGIVCFSAVYLRHHYLIDLLAGIFYAGITYLLLYFLFYKKEESKKIPDGQATSS